LSPRPRATFAKRQKEQARQEKQRAKAERKQQRKLGIQTDDSSPDSGLDFEAAGPEQDFEAAAPESEKEAVIEP